MRYEFIRYEHDDGVALITLDRPARLNAMHGPLLAELRAACDAAEADAGAGAVVLTGSGTSFCSGFDLKAQAADPPRGAAAWRPVLEDDFATVMRFWHLSKPTVSAVRGHCLAGGFELAMACDLCVAADDALFGEPELAFGAGIVVMLLPWLTTPKIAKELILTAGDPIPAARALAAGLVNRVVPAGAEVGEALALARRMARMEPSIVKATKAAINRSYAIKGFDEALRAALEADVAIEGAGTATKRRFLEIARDEGLRAAVAWRDARLEGEPDR